MIVLIAGLFFYGSCFGSFMNVVVYRLPAGLSVVLPASRCPRCRQRIRPLHNIPVFGWLLLRGKCYDCQLPISCRYPLVEAAVGLLFVGIGSADVLARFALVPSAFDPLVRSADSAITLWCACAYHALLLCTLICAVLIEGDENEIPRRLFLPALVGGFAIPLAFVDVRVLAISPGTMSLPDWQSAIVDGVAGGMVGLALGLVFMRMDRTRREVLLASLFLAGVFLGWQLIAAVVFLLVLLVLLQALVTGWGPRRHSPASSGISTLALLTLSVAVCIIYRDAWIDDLSLSTSASLWVLWQAAVCAALISWLIARGTAQATTACPNEHN